MYEAILLGFFHIPKKGSTFNKYSYDFKIMAVEVDLSGKNGGLKLMSLT